MEYCVNFLNLKNNVCKIVGCFKKDVNSKIEHNIYTLKQYKKFIKQCDNLKDKI